MTREGAWEAGYLLISARESEGLGNEVCNGKKKISRAVNKYFACVIQVIVLRFRGTETQDI